jgi:hypothetical protein
MLYEMHCRGHARRFRSAGGDNKSGLRFCSGCRMRPVSKFLKNSDSDAGEFCGGTLACIDVAAFDTSHQNF